MAHVTEGIYLLPSTSRYSFTVTKTLMILWNLKPLVAYCYIHINITMQACKRDPLVGCCINLVGVLQPYSLLMPLLVYRNGQTGGV